MDNPELLYRSAAQTDAVAVSDIVKFFPVPQIGDLCYGIKQDFEQLSTSFVPLAHNTVHPNDATCFLQLEEQTTDQGALLTHWTRSYFQIPPSWDDWENTSYTFPQYPGYTIQPGVAATPVGRDPYTPANGVKCRVHYDYFMVGSGQTYANEGLIPDIPVQTFSGKLNPQYFSSPPQVVDNVADGGTLVGNSFYLESVPNKTLYLSWAANAAANGWASGRVGTADANPGQIVISCKPERLAGNIWARITRYVLAQ